jgi:hypothetical protein
MKSHSIPISNRIKRTPSELQLREDEQLVDFRDHVMYTQIVDHFAIQRDDKMAYAWRTLLVLAMNPRTTFQCALEEYNQNVRKITKHKIVLPFTSSEIIIFKAHIFLPPYQLLHPSNGRIFI